jgi:hypothetical protein
MDRELLDAQVMVGGLVPPSSVFAFLAEHRRELFPDAFTADLFGSRTGGPSLPADVLGGERHADAGVGVEAEARHPAGRSADAAPDHGRKCADATARPQEGH